MKWAGHVALMRERRVVYRVLVGKPEGKKPLGRPRRRWKCNMKMDLQEDERIILGWIFKKWDVGGMDWIDVAHNRDRCQALVNAAMNFQVP
jgi:hypothetical protein